MKRFYPHSIQNTFESQLFSRILGTLREYANKISVFNGTPTYLPFQMAFFSIVLSDLERFSYYEFLTRANLLLMNFKCLWDIYVENVVSLVTGRFSVPKEEELKSDDEFEENDEVVCMIDKLNELIG